MKYTKAEAEVVLFNDADTIVASGRGNCLFVLNTYFGEDGNCTLTLLGILSEDEE